MTVDVLNIRGEKTGRSVELPADIFGIEPNDHCIYLAVKQYMAAQRQGTHKTKGRSEVQGSSKKLHKQKGTGGSRKGNIRNPLYKGGGTMFGPKPHSYTFKLNRQVKNIAKMSALTYKARESKVVVVEDLAISTPRTKDFAGMLNALKGESRKTMVILPAYDQNVYLSGRNIASHKTALLHDINTYDITNANVLIFTESAVSKLNEGELTEA